MEWTVKILVLDKSLCHFSCTGSHCHQRSSVHKVQQLDLDKFIPSLFITCSVYHKVVPYLQQSVATQCSRTVEELEGYRLELIATTRYDTTTAFRVIFLILEPVAISAICNSILFPPGNLVKTYSDSTYQPIGSTLPPAGWRRLLISPFVWFHLKMIHLYLEVRSLFCIEAIHFVCVSDADLQQQSSLHGLLTGDEIRLHQQNVLAQLLHINTFHKSGPSSTNRNPATAQRFYRRRKNQTHPDLNQLLHKVEEQRVDFLQFQHRPWHHQGQVAHWGAADLMKKGTLSHH